MEDQTKTPEEMNRETEAAAEAADREDERRHHQSHQKWLEKRVQLFSTLALELAMHTSEAEDDHDVSLAQANKARVLEALNVLLLPPPEPEPTLFERLTESMGHGFGSALENPEVRKAVQEMATNFVSSLPMAKPIVETPERVDVSELTDEELDADIASVLEEHHELVKERARRQASATASVVLPHTRWTHKIFGPATASFTEGGHLILNYDEGGSAIYRDLEAFKRDGWTPLVDLDPTKTLMTMPDEVLAKMAASIAAERERRAAPPPGP